ncbi:protein LTV1 homolog isoform X2 [Glandiceps talaboti]
MGANESQSVIGNQDNLKSNTNHANKKTKSKDVEEKKNVINENSRKKKPGKKSKKFIDKKKAANFQLVHRSQRDPLQADEESSQHVLRPLETTDEDSRREEQKKYGVYFEDDYNYLQHLKEPNQDNELIPSDKPKIPPKPSTQTTDQEPKLQLPASAFGSQVEEKTGMLNKAAPISGPRLDLDPDVVAAMDEDFDFDNPDNELDDDFILQANEPKAKGCPFSSSLHRQASIADMEDLSDVEYGSDEADIDDLDSQGAHTFSEEETKSRFTSYSMTSSVIKRNEGLTLLDDRFEKIYEQYDDDEIGALDHEEVAGNIQPDSDLLSAVLSEFEKKQRESKTTNFTASETSRPSEIKPVEKKQETVVKEESSSMDGEGDDRKGLPDLRRDIIDVNYDDDYSTSSSEDELVAMVTQEPKEEWDCETVISTYSNLHNHPTVIAEPTKPKPKKIELSQKTGMPKDVLPKRNQPRRPVNDSDSDSDDLDEDFKRPVAPPRRKNETPEERRARKQMVKQDRRDRRVEKKANQQAFKTEEKRQEKVMINLQQNMQGMKMT